MQHLLNILLVDTVQLKQITDTLSDGARGNQIMDNLPTHHLEEPF